jgi:hypothetical protein
MTSRRYKALLRGLYGAIFSSNLSVSDLRQLAKELRQGRISDELAYMIDRALLHLSDQLEDELDDNRLGEAERLIKRARTSKASLANLVESLGGSPSSSKATVREMLREFFDGASPSQANKLLELLDSSRSDDQYLTGIRESRG